MTTATITATASAHDTLASEPHVEPEAPPTRAVEPGDCLGRYTIRALIGAGGMGRVFAASDSELGRTVALKVIRPERGASSQARARLLREAQALAQVRHPNVVTIHDVGSEAGQVFLAMELVEGVTLADWLGDAPRPWPAIRDVVLAAGRGLAAAHAAGIVHRDFKPHNVIVGGDRVVVVDFGLARADREPGDEAPAGAPPAGLGVALTLTGERVGTPHYMAPEQRAGAPTTAASDQYAFCVVLYEALYGALYGARPAGGAPAEPRGVPRFVAAAIARGLSAQPEARWPSMEALLAALDRRFWTRRRTRIALATAAALVAAIAIAGFTAGRRAAAVASCGGGEALVAPLWSDAARDEVRAAFRRGQPALADAAFVQVDAGVRARVGDWARAFRDNCEASHVRHAQSEAMLDLRTQCLGRARAELASLIDLLRKADAATVSRAARAVSDGGDLGPCADPAALGAAIAPPLPLQAAAVGALRDDLSRTTPLFDLGKWPEARAATRALVARARALGYRPLLARVLAQQGHIEANTGEPDAAIRDLYEVAALATAVGDDDVLATALPWLGFALGYGKERYDAAESVHRWAAAEVERAGPTPARRSSLYGNRAVVLGRQGDHAGALAIFRDLRALEAARRGPDSLSAGWADKSIGDELTALGRAREATPYEARAARLVERALGAENPTTATVLAGYGVNLVETFEPQAALAVLARAQAIYERTIGPEDLRVAAVLNTTSVARLALRQLPQARAALEHAIAIHHARDPAEGRNVANEYDVLSDIAQREGKREEAHALAARAIAIKRGVLDPMHEEVGLSYRIDAEHLRALGRIADARAAIDHALAITRKANGEQHPAYAEALIVHGDVLRAEHHDGDAITAYERALAILDPAYGATSIGLCPVLARLSAAVLDAGEPARAEAYAARDLALAVHAAPGEREIAELRLAEARWALAHDRPAALALARHARDGLAALPFPSDELPRAERWLASR